MLPSTSQRPSLFALLAVAVAASTVLPCSEAFLKFPSISRRSTRETIFSDAGDASSSRNYLASMVPQSTSNYFRRLVGFRPVYADTADAVAAAGNNNDVAAAKSTDQSGRLFNLFNPFNPLNPFANLITLPTNQNGLNILQIKGKQSIIARANIISNAAVAVGTLQFIQESPFKPIVVVGAGTGPLAAQQGLTNLRIEITANAAGTAAGACAAATMGTVFNPTGVTDGGVLATTLSTDAGGRFRVFINTVPATRASLFSPNSIINHGVRLQVANALDANVMCGTITFVA